MGFDKMKILPSWMYKNKKQKYTAVSFILSIPLFAFAVVYNSVFGLTGFNLIFLFASGFVFWIAGVLYIKFSDNIEKGR